MDPVLITGKVRITEDSDGRLLAVSLRSDDGRLFRVFLDAQGELLGLDMAGFRAEVHASLQERDDGTWLRVINYDEAEQGSHDGRTDDTDTGRDLQPALVRDDDLEDDENEDEDLDLDDEEDEDDDWYDEEDEEEDDRW